MRLVFRLLLSAWAASSAGCTSLTTASRMLDSAPAGRDQDIIEWTANTVQLAEFLEQNRLVCAYTKDNRFEPVGDGTDPRIRHLSETDALMQFLPPDPDVSRMPPEAWVCQSDMRKAFAGVHGKDLHTTLLFHSSGNKLRDALTRLHENDHSNLIRRFPAEYLQGFRLSGAPELSFIGAEGGAYTLEYTSPLVLRLRGTPEFWDSFGEKNAYAKYIDQLTRLYDRAELDKHTARGTLPPLLRRLFYSHVVADVAKHPHYILMRAGLPKRVVDHDRADAFLQATYPYLQKAEGLSRYMQAYLDNQRTPSPAGLVSVMAGLLDPALNKDAVQTHRQQLTVEYNKLDEAGVLDHPFLVRDLKEAARRFHNRAAALAVPETARVERMIVLMELADQLDGREKMLSARRGMPAPQLLPAKLKRG
jgi:hypothetical protein